MGGLSEDALRNREDWTKANAEYTDARASHAWSRDEITWGVFGVPEASIGTLGDVDGLDVVELGCGTAYVSAWLARRGARPVGVDVTPAQLATARRCQAARRGRRPACARARGFCRVVTVTVRVEMAGMVMDEVRVSATRTERLAGETPIRVEVIGTR